MTLNSAQLKYIWTLLEYVLHPLSLPPSRVLIRCRTYWELPRPHLATESWYRFLSFVNNINGPGSIFKQILLLCTYYCVQMLRSFRFSCFFWSKSLCCKKRATNSFLGLNEANKLFKCQSSESLWVNKVQVLCNTLKPSILSLSAPLSLLWSAPYQEWWNKSRAPLCCSSSSRLTNKCQTTIGNWLMTSSD